MAIRCPYCQHSINVKNAKPGRYSPKCPKCAKPFSLTVPADLEAEWVAVAILPATPTPKPPQPVPPPRPQSQPAPDATEATSRFEPLDPPSPMLAQKPVAEETRHVPIDADRTVVLADPARGSVVEERVEETRTEPTSTNDREIPDKLGGYEVIKELGRGGMGSVYLARQISLDRAVALKVMNARWASDPIFLARFTREAYAAAQLVHHNVVQIYDIGEEKGLNFFSMEFVDGRSLGDLIKKDGKLDTEAAVGYALQAARGLKFAHDRGMIHRDVKPDNLILNTQGIVKVADLGLVKTPEMSRADDAVSEEQPALTDVSQTRKTRTGLGSLPADMTYAHSAMGSPAYMSPEQCRDAASVDQRADIYSLGCSLYVLLTGQTPFKGSTAFEVMTKHTSDPPAPPDQVVKTVPPEMSALVLKMLEKDPARRYQTMDELIRDLEKWLGVKGAGFQPNEENLGTLEKCVERFNGCTLAKLRQRLIQGFLIGTLLGAAVALFISMKLAVGLIGLLIQTTLAYFIISGISDKTDLFRKTRQLAFGSRRTDWLMMIFMTALLFLLLFLTGFLWAWLGFGVVGVILALGLHVLIDRRVAAQRQPSLVECENMFKRMRLHGCDEETLRRFVAANSGRRWEEFYEALFGFEAKLTARAALGDVSRQRVRHAPWREPILRWIERAQTTRQEARERKHLQALEAKKLRAEGMAKREAEEQAEAAAAQLVEQAAEIKAADVQRTRHDVADETVAHQKPVNINQMLEAAEKPPKKLPKPPAQPLKHLILFLFGWKLRFILGALLITGAVLWVKQNLTRLGKDEEISKGATSAADIRDVEQAKQEAEKAYNLLKSLIDSKEPWQPLDLSFLPPVVAGFFDHINSLVAGLILILSVFTGNVVRVLLFLVAAAVVLAGHMFPIPALGPLQPHHLTMIAGASVALLAMLVGRRKE